MSVFASRTSGYRGGVILLYIAFIVFLVGNVSPYWLSSTTVFASIGTINVYRTVDEGVWMACVFATGGGYSASTCGIYAVDKIVGWRHAVRALECIGGIGLVVACIYALATNCCRSLPGPHTRILETLSGVSGLLGFIGCMVFVGKTEDKELLQWAFYLSTVGSVLCVVAAIIIAVCNRPLEPVLQGVVNAVPMTTAPQGQGHPAAGGPYGHAQPTQPYGYPQYIAGPQSSGSPQSYGNPQIHSQGLPHGQYYSQPVKAGDPGQYA